MKKNRILVLALFCVPFILKSQEVIDSVAPPKNWQLGGKSGLTLTQTGQVNWVQGGEPSLSYLATMELFAKYNKNKHSWETEGKFAYGQQAQGYDSELRESDDKIDIVSKYGHKISKTTYMTVLAAFKSQFRSGHEYPDNAKKVEVSKFFSPAYITGALGIDYKPNEKTSVFISPVSMKSIVVLDTALDETKYGLDLGETSRMEVGAFLKASNVMSVIENVDMENTLELFSNYLEDPQNIDVIWNFKLTMSVNKYLKTVLSTTLIYDDNIAIPKDINDPAAGSTKAVQFKEMLSVGFLVTF